MFAPESPAPSSATGLTGKPGVLIYGEGYLLRQNEAVPHSDDFSPSATELLLNNATFVSQFGDVGLALAPLLHLAIVACMDSRMDIFQMLGLRHGDAHIIRNAGGVVTDDVVRSLVVSQRLLNTQEIILIHHTDCGLQKISEEGFKDEIEQDCGTRPHWIVEAFSNPFDAVRESIKRLQNNPFVIYKQNIRGFVYDVETGKLLEA
jgi:carbonic anhydrase